MLLSMVLKTPRWAQDTPPNTEPEKQTNNNKTVSTALVARIHDCLSGHIQNITVFYFLYLPDFQNCSFAINVLHFGYAINSYVSFRRYQIWSELHCSCGIIYSLSKDYQLIGTTDNYARCWVFSAEQSRVPAGVILSPSLDICCPI